MKTRWVSTHVPAVGDEAGCIFEVLSDEDAVLSRERIFFHASPALLALAQEETLAAIAASLEDLNLPPGKITTALMKARNAQQEEEIARTARLEEEAKASEASQAASQAREAAEQAALAAERETAKATAIAEANAREATKLATARAERDALAAEIAALRAAKGVEPAGR